MLKDAELTRRQQSSQKVAVALEPYSDISAVLIFGSVASGEVDAASDVDVFVVCDKIPSISVRTKIADSSGTKLEDTVHEGELFGVVDELKQPNGLKLTLHYQRVDLLETVITEVLAGALTTSEIPFRPYTLLGLLQRSWVLLDKHKVVEKWLGQIQTYPPHLKENLLGIFIPKLEEHTAELTETATRGLGTRTFIFYLNWGVDALISILLAVNERYDPADKRFESSVLPLLTYKPDNFDARLQDILVGPFDKAGMRERAQVFEALAAEVLTIARTQHTPMLTWQLASHTRVRPLTRDDTREVYTFITQNRQHLDR